MADEIEQAVARTGSFWQTLRAVAWAFFGVRKSSEQQKDMSRLNPLHVVVAGLVGAGLFIALLLFVVNWVTTGSTSGAAAP